MPKPESHCGPLALLAQISREFHSAEDVSEALAIGWTGAAGSSSPLSGPETVTLGVESRPRSPRKPPIPSIDVALLAPSSNFTSCLPLDDEA